MSERDIQDMLMTVIEGLIDGRDEVEGDDDDAELADVARDLIDETQSLTEATSFEDAALLTSNEGLVIRTADGSEFQISIVQRR